MILNCNEIIPDRLWVGAYLMPDDVRRLTALGITGAVCLQTDEDLRDHRIPIGKLLDRLEEAGIDFYRTPARDFDREALARSLPDCVAELEKALARRGARVYLYCTAGINRSPTVAAAYLVKNRGLSAADAFDYVESRRHCNPYRDVLEKYEAALGRAADGNEETP